MMHELKLPTNLFPYESSSLIRIGSSQDGSYLVDQNSISESEMLISIGVGWSFEFEKSFLKIKKVPLLAFDGTSVIKASLNKLKYRLKKIVKGNSLKYFIDSFFFLFYPIHFYIFYKNILSTNLNKNFRKFIKKNVGLKNSQISISEILSNFNLDKKFSNVFFQIDIEGGEYEILNEILLHQKIISGLIIEFHDLDLNINKVLNFIDTFNLKLVHTHINNVGGLTQSGLPKVIELTFSKYSTNNKVKKLPHPLDKPNSKSHFEYVAFI